MSSFEMHENPMAKDRKRLPGAADPPRAPSQTKPKSKGAGGGKRATSAISAFQTGKDKQKNKAENGRLRQMSSALDICGSGQGPRKHRRQSDYFDDPSTKLTFSRAVMAHEERVNCVGITDDDSHFISCGNDGTMAIVKRATSQDWNSALSRVAGSAVLGADKSDSTDQTYQVKLGGKIWCCSISSNKRIYLGFYDGCIASYDIDGGPVIPKFKAHTDFLRAVEVCPKEKLIISCSHDCTVKIWKLSSDKKKVEDTTRNRAFEKKGSSSDLALLQPSKYIEEPDRVNAVAICPNRKLFATANADDNIRIYHLTPEKKRGDQIMKLEGHTNDVRSVCFTPIHSSKKWNTLRNVAAFAQRFNSFDNIKYDLVSGSYDRTIKVWDIFDGKCLKTLHGHDHIVKSVCALGKGQFIASSSLDKTIRIWDLQVGAEVRKLENIHSDEVNAVLFTKRDGYKLLSGSHDKLVKVTNLGVRVPLHKEALILNEHKKDISNLAYSEDGHTLVTASFDNHVILHDLSRIEREQMAKFKEDTAQVVDEEMYFPEDIPHLDKVFGLAVSRDAKTIISSSLASFIRITSIQTSTANESLHKPDAESKKVTEIELKDSKNDDRKAFVRTIALCNNEKYFLTGANDGTIERWRLYGLGEDGKRKAKSIEDFPHGDDPRGGHSMTVTAIGITSDDRYAVSASHDSTCIVWDLVSDGEWNAYTDDARKPPAVCVKHHCKHNIVGKIRALAVSQDSIHPFFVAGGDDKIVRMWSISTGALLKNLHQHTDRVTTLAISPSCKHIATGSRDRRVILWDKDSGEDILTVHADFFADEREDDARRTYSSGRQKNAIDMHDYPTILKFAPDGNYLSFGTSGSHIVTFFVASSYDIRPSSLQSISFLDALRESQRSFGAYDWAESSLLRLIQQNPLLLCEPRFDDSSLDTLVHVAAREGCSNFLADVLAFDTPKRALVSMTVCLMKNKAKKGEKSGKTPLEEAMQSKSRASVAAILRAYGEILCAKHVMPKNLKLCQERHLSEDIDVHLLCQCLNQFPDVTLSFIRKHFHLLPAGDPSVRGKCDRVKLNRERLVIGSSARSPRRFWSDVLYGSKTPASGRVSEIQEEAEAMIDYARRRLAHRRTVYFPGTKYRLWGDTKIVRSAKDDQTGVPVSALFVPIKNIAGPTSDFLRALIKAAEKCDDFAVFENEVIKAIIEFKWQFNVSRTFTKYSYCHFVMVVLLTVDALIVPDMIAAGTFELQSSWPALVPLVLASVINVCFFYHEVNQAYAEYQLDVALDLRDKSPFMGLLAFITKHSDMWNMLDWVSLFFITLCCTSRVMALIQDDGSDEQREHSEWSSFWQAVALPFTFMNMLYYLQVNAGMGKFIRMIVGIVRGIGLFVAVLILTIIGFATSFYTLKVQAKYGSRKDEDSEVTDHSFFLSIFSGYLHMLGTDKWLDAFPSSTSFVLACILFLAFTFIVNVVFLNLLIAIMGDLFDRVQDRSKAEFLYAKAKIVAEFESLISHKDRLGEGRLSKGRAGGKFPLYLQILQPTPLEIQVDGHSKSFVDDDAEAWGGKIREMRKNTEEVKKDIASMNEQIKRLTDMVADERARVKID